MKTRIHNIKIQNFKAFRNFELNLEGRHLLVYGANGSGKSSLYWALYTFLQSAGKQTTEVSKYFDPSNTQNLLNIHEQKEAMPKKGEIVLTLRDVAGNDVVFRISQATHGTHAEPVIVKGSLASDFITYRFFFGFSDFRNSADFNIWPLFEREILPFCVDTGVAPGEYEENWIQLQKENPNPNAYRGRAGAKAFRDFNSRLQAYSNKISVIVDSISTEAQAFYNYHFADGDKEPITLKLKVTAAAHYSKPTAMVIPPILKFGIMIGADEVKKPQSYLNEAKMTQLALSVRLAASLVNLQEDEQNYFKLLVLDDLLVSLDMSNRMKVVKILLSDTFSNYQKIILTHDYGFFREFRRQIGSDHPNWRFIRLEDNAATGVQARDEKDELQKAEDYIHGHNFDEAALCLRKHCEEAVSTFFSKGRIHTSKEFKGFSASLREARNKILEGFPSDLYQKVLKGLPPEQAEFLIPVDDFDLETNTDLSRAARGKLKVQRKRMRQIITIKHAKLLQQIDILDRILACTDRVLNPAAHSGNPPLYKLEVENALELARQLDGIFSSPTDASTQDTTS